MGKERDIDVAASFQLTPPEARPSSKTTKSHHADPRDRKVYACRFCGGRWKDKAWFLYHPCAQARFRQVVLAELPKDHPNARKCSPLARAKTRNVIQLRKDMEAANQLEGRTRRHRRRLPVVREVCDQEQRPCGYLTCRHHNAFEYDAENGSVKELFPQFRIYDDPAGPGLLLLEMVVGTCSLDTSDGEDDGSRGVNGLQELRKLAEAGKPIGATASGMSLEQTAEHLHISIERVRQIGGRGMHEVRVALAAEKGPQRE